MTDPLSVTASVLAVATAAVVSVRSLCDTIKSFRNRNNTLRRLQDTLQDLTSILNSLISVIDADTSILVLLEGPIDRCRGICTEFAQSMQKFHDKSQTSLLDWTKLEFKRGDINDFIDTIEGYKSTIMVGLGTVNLQNSKVSLEVLHQYEETIKDTTYNLQVHLQQIDEKLSRYQSQDSNTLDAKVDLRDERAVTQQCLRICQNASSYIESLASRESAFLRDQSPVQPESRTQGEYEAQTLLRQAFSTSRTAFTEVVNHLGERLQSVVMDQGDENEGERSRLQRDLDISKQCLQVCEMAGKMNNQKIHTIGEAIAEDNSDQVVVTTLADLFDVKQALSKGHSAQLVATLTPDNFDRVVEQRYNSRFGAVSDHAGYSKLNDIVSATVSSSRDDAQRIPSIVESSPSPQVSEVKRPRPNPNEMRKRGVDGSSQR